MLELGFCARLLYIDVGLMSTIPSLIAAAVITIGAVAGVLWRRFKKKVKANLNIDENTNKKFEDDIELVENPQDAAPEQTTEAESTAASCNSHDLKQQ